VRRIIADSGPLISLFDPSEPRHEEVKSYIGEFSGLLLTTWPVVTEVSHMLGYSVDRQIAFLHWIERGALEILEQPIDMIRKLIALMEKYRDRPMDLADASLIVLSMQSGIRDIITFDSDFDFYRLPDRSKLKNQLTRMRQR
jgi:predicted nucleic acid-binding protein